MTRMGSYKKKLWGTQLIRNKTLKVESLGDLRHFPPYLAELPDRFGIISTSYFNHLRGLGRCKERCPASINEKLMNHAPSGTEARYYDQLSVFNRAAEMPVRLDPVEELKKNHKEY